MIDDVQVAGAPLDSSVIVVTRNRRAHLCQCLESVERLRYPAFDVVVVDNGSTDGTVEMMASRFPSFKLIRLGRNVGCPAARNIGILNSSGELLLFLDDDGAVEAEALQEIAAEMRRDERVGAVACAIQEGSEWLLRPEETRLGLRVYIQESRGQGALRRSALKAVGLYPWDFTYGAEELDLSLRLLASGYRIVFQPRARTTHDRASLSRWRRQNLECYTNIIRVIWKYAPVSLLIPWTLEKLVSMVSAAFRHGDVPGLGRELARLPLALSRSLAQRQNLGWEVFAERAFLARNTVTSVDYPLAARKACPSVWTLLRRSAAARSSF